ncbi:glycosyltransferase family 4 protein [Oleiharenicola sp. Vm1]|uniref:glycosyltransferase family 4 protein n=1 Tax=Oleiharenicola sp. Vm1 TaxID=3398393 RepID=UPI0039F4B891
MPRHRPKFTGLFPDDVDPDSFWIRETGVLALPPLVGVREILVQGELRPADPADSTSRGSLGLVIRCDGADVSATASLAEGPFSFRFSVPTGDANAPHRLEFLLVGVGFSNFLAWLGRVSGLAPLQPWRHQSRNRRLRIRRVEADGEVLFDFANRAAPWNPVFARRFLRLGFNLLGYLRADLGIGESARCMARAADVAQLPVALVDLRLPCKNPRGDDTFAARLQSDLPHRVTIVHVDAPGMRDLEHHHGADLRRDRYTIGYWAWELPEFPDAWIQYADYCDEIWAPSRFAAEAIAAKVPVPVLAMPHAISFARPQGDFRAKFNLPREQFLFLFLYDLNSYSARKNPGAVIEAFRRSGLAGRGAALVIKVHNAAGNPDDFARLQRAAAELPGTVLINATLSRVEIYELESACDCFVSLHRSEGFGFAVAEAMYLGKPVISTDWSGTAEFVDATNGCPVRAALVSLDRNHGPYAKGQIWAEPDVAHAAEWMQRLFADRALAARLGTAGQRTIEAQFSPAAIGARYRRRLEAIAGW